MPKRILIILDENTERKAAIMKKINNADMVLIKRENHYYVTKNKIDYEFADRNIDHIEKMKKSDKYEVEEI